MNIFFFIISFYIILFVFGNLLIFGDSGCGDISPNHLNVAIAFIIMGYSYLGVPILLFSSLCLCLPFVLIMYLIISRNDG